MFISDLRENFVDELLQPHGPLVELAVRLGLLGAGAETFVGDVCCLEEMHRVHHFIKLKEPSENGSQPSKTPPAMDS